MALSEQEQRLLEQLEAALAEEDPTFANTLRGTGARTLHRRRAALAGVGFLIGVAALVAGIEVHWAVSVLGFAIMLASTIVALNAWQHVDAGASRTAGARQVPDPTAFMDRMEDRWRRRNEEGQQ